MKTIFVELFNDEAGATVIEYALLASLIGIALVGSIRLMTGSISTKFGKIGSNLS